MKIPPLWPMLCLAMACDISPPGKERNKLNTSKRAIASRKVNDTVVRRALDVHGARGLGTADVRFSFRGTPYRMARHRGHYLYEVTKTGEHDHQRFRLNNQGFEQWLNGKPIKPSPTKQQAQKNALISVIYFASIPWVLGDRAVHVETLPDTEFQGETHSTRRVTFDRQSGGADHDDVFAYWFERDTGRLAFLAYRFHVNGGGVRLRQVIRVQRIQGIDFFDYNNYSAPTATRLPDLLSLLAEGEVQLISVITMEKIQVLELGNTPR